MYTEVPAHVRHEHQTVNGIQVKGGTNWDLSRSAAETPIALAPSPPAAAPCDCESPMLESAYRPQDRMPRFAPTLTVTFGRNSAVLSTSATREMRALAPSAVVLAAHADSRERSVSALAQRRAQTVAAALRRYGHRVEHTQSFSTTRPLADSALNAQQNRRVDVWAKPKE